MNVYFDVVDFRRDGFRFADILQLARHPTYATRRVYISYRCPALRRKVFVEGYDSRG